jgi:hypothetical protein
MSTPLKLAAFAAVLALVFGAATVAGGAIGPDREGAADERAQNDAHGAAEPDAHAPEAEHGSEAADPIRGLAVADRGLRLELERTQLPRGRETMLRFAIRDEDGGAVRDFEVEHSKRMHLIVVRRDGRGFQHLHPRLVDGEWRTPVTLPQAGSYRVFADFKRDGRAYTLAADLGVNGAANYRALPARSNVARTDGYEVRVDDELNFTITRDGREIETQPYLGAGGHLVALREGDLAYLHVHPEGEGVAFEADLEPESRYRLYLQFKHDGRIHTAEFTR